jgi:predicted dehydrogenase
LRERVAAGEIGRPITARAEFSILGKGHPRKWMCDPEIAGGGPIADLGVHCIDALRYILDDEVAGVNARAMSDADSGKVEAAAGLLLQFSRGALGMVLVSTRAAYRTPIEIVGDRGMLRASSALSVDEPVRLELWRGGELVDIERVVNHEAFSRMLDAFALSVQGLQKFPCPAEEGLKNQLVVDEAYKQL